MSNKQCPHGWIEVRCIKCIPIRKYTRKIEFKEYTEIEYIRNFKTKKLMTLVNKLEKSLISGNMEVTENEIYVTGTISLERLQKLINKY